MGHAEGSLKAPGRIVGAVIAVERDGVRSYDTVRRAWWRGERLTRVELKHLGAVAVESVDRIGEGEHLEGLRLLQLAPKGGAT